VREHGKKDVVGEGTFGGGYSELERYKLCTYCGLFT
jgi:hypothetical protein